MATKKTKKSPTFEDDLQQIEKLVTDMQEKGLDETVDTYAEAMKLIIKCKKTLNGYKAKLQSIDEDAVSDIRDDAGESED